MQMFNTGMPEGVERRGTPAVGGHFIDARTQGLQGFLCTQAIGGRRGLQKVGRVLLKSARLLFLLKHP